VNTVNNDLNGIADSVQHNQLTAFWTDGHFSHYQLVATLLRYTGIADIYFSTWSITEEPIRALWQMKEQQLIKSITGVVDHRIKVNSPKGFQFAMSFFDKLVLQKVHAKITVLIGATANLVVIGSANWTKNPRLESGIIFCDNQIALFYQNLILENANAGTNHSNLRTL
jgi:hypothetical protein